MQMNRKKNYLNIHNQITNQPEYPAVDTTTLCLCKRCACHSDGGGGLWFRRWIHSMFSEFTLGTELWIFEIHSHLSYDCEIAGMHSFCHSMNTCTFWGLYELHCKLKLIFHASNGLPANSS